MKFHIFFSIQLILFVSARVFAAPILINQISDLDFGVAYLGDTAKLVASGSVDNAENASFLVTGDPSVTFVIALPGSIFMNHSVTSSQIQIQNFTSTPVTGLLQPNGEQLLLVGATREALGMGLDTGTYSGTFVITVVY